jgi:1-acyl-sn-glycerol-3-phosphate acyltransferase
MTWFYYVVKLVLWVVFRIGFGLEVRGQEHVPKRGPCILASNHVSFLDPPLVGVAAPRRATFMARADLYRYFWLGLFLRGVGAVSLRRGEADVGAVREALKRLRLGQAVAIFPEGGRQPSGALGQAKRGVGLLAAMGRAPIVPVLVRGTFEALPRGASSLRRAKIRVAFGPPIPYTEAPLASRDHQERLAEAVTSAWHRLAEYHP